MNPNKALWEMGDFTRIAATMRESGAAFVSTLGIAKGINILDLGCGDGTTAIPAAKLCLPYGLSVLQALPFGGFQQPAFHR